MDGFQEYILDCKSRNLRERTIHHYEKSIKQIYKRIPPDTPISAMNEQTMREFYIALREAPNLNDVSMGTYARDLKTLMRFFMKCQYIPHFEIQLPKADQAPIQTYTDEELRLLLKKPDVRKCLFSIYRSWAIVSFLLSTGVRQNSLVSIHHFSKLLLRMPLLLSERLDPLADLPQIDLTHAITPQMELCVYYKLG